MVRLRQPVDALLVNHGCRRMGRLQRPTRLAGRHTREPRIPVHRLARDLEIAADVTTDALPRDPIQSGGSSSPVLRLSEHASAGGGAGLSLPSPGCVGRRCRRQGDPS